MATIFSKIISGEIPSYKVAEDEHHLAFLDIRPVVYGHTLVIPKKEVNYYFDMEDEDLFQLNLFAKRVAKILDQEIDCLRVGVMIAGLEVPHAHIHLIPINSVHELSFSNERAQISQEEMMDLSVRLSNAFAKYYL